MMTLYRIVVFILCILGSSIGLAEENAQLVNKVLATVGGKVITYYDVMEKLLPTLQEAGLSLNKSDDAVKVQRLQETILNDLINNKLIELEAEHYGIVVTDSEVDAEMRRIARENDISLGVLLEQIQFQGNTESLFREQLRENMLRQRVVGSFVFRKIVVTVNEVESYYQAHKEEYRGDTEYSLSYIAFPSKVEAEQILHSIQSGKMTFASALEQYTDDSYGSGELGTFLYTELDPSWQYVLDGVKKGDTVGVLPVEGRFFLLYVDAMNLGKLLPLSEVYAKIEQKIRDSRFAKTYATFIESIRKKTDVTLY